MTYLVISAVILTVLTVTFLYFAFHAERESFFILGGFSGAITIIFACLCSIFGYQWLAADYQAKIVNRALGTNYSRQDLFYAKDVIDEIQQINRKRIEVNGNVMQNKCPENAEASAVANTIVEDEVNASFSTDTDTSLTY
jgi:hypothetical protein